MKKQMRSFKLSFLDKEQNEIIDPIILYYTKNQCKQVVKHIFNMNYSIPGLHKISVINN